MDKLQFKYAKAVNFLCFGSEGVEFHFSDYGNVIQVQGENLDNPCYKDDPASNGAGKSSLQEIISFALYGKTVKSPTKNKTEQIVNAKAGEEDVTIILEFDDVRIERTVRQNASNKLRCWESEDGIWDKKSEVTKIGTQKWIEKKIGLSHHAFCLR